MSARTPRPLPVACAGTALVLLCLVDAVRALDPSKAITQYSHSSWQTDDGLPQNTVRAIAQTPDGYLWAGTEAGLVRFDGVRFRVFDRTTHPQIFDNHHIYALATAPDGALWIGTNGDGLVRLDDGEFQTFGTGDGLPAGRITALDHGRDGELWIGTYGGGVAVMREGAIQDVFDQRAGLAHPVVFDVAVDRAGDVWVATYGGGLNRLRDGRFEVFDTSNGLTSNQVWSVHPGRGGDLWIGTDGGLHRLSQGHFEIFTTDDGLPHDRIISVIEDRDGVVWVGTYGGGLGRWLDGSASHLERDRSQWTSNSVWTLFEDREGTLWAGTLGGGLNQLKDGPFTTYSVAEGLSSEIVSSLFEPPGGDLWIATRGGLNRFHQGSFEVLTTADGLASKNLWTVYGDRQENLWVGHSGAGIDRLYRGRWHNLGIDDGLADGTVLAILEDRRGDLWIATNAGLNRLRDGILTTLTTADGLAGNNVRSILEDRQGDLWIGTTEGLSRFDGSVFVNFTAADGLGGNNVDTLLQDADGSLWIATRGGGLSRLRGDEMQTFTTRDGLLDDDVRGILDDGAGHLWLSTSRGISQVAKADVDAFAQGRVERIGGIVYGRRDGLKNETCFGSQKSSVATRDGRLWFATLDGVAVVDPSRLQPTPAPAVLIEQVTVDGVTRSHGSPTGGALPRLEPLPPDTRTVELRFTAPTLLVPGKIELRYRLRGFDDAWQSAGGLRTASYNNLDPGAYTFEAMASDEARRWNGEVTALTFRIRPAFYQTLTFRALCVLALALLALALHNARTLRLRRRARQLSEQVEQVLAKLRVLRGLLPICSSCKKIRDDQGDWTDLETYIDAHSEAAFTHGICPGCTARYRESLAESKSPPP